MLWVQAVKDNCDWGEGRGEEGRSGEGRSGEGRGGTHGYKHTKARGAGGMSHIPEKFFIIRCIRLPLRLFLDQNLLLSLGL